MLAEILAIGLVISAVLAIESAEAVYSVGALACTFIFTAILYALNDAMFAAIFQLAVGIGTLVILFLSGEALSEKTEKKKSKKYIGLTLIIGFLISLPTIFFSITITPSTISSTVEFGQAIWDLRGIDIILQGLVMVTIALGVGIILHQKREGRQ